MGEILRRFETAVSSSVRNNDVRHCFSLKKRQQSRNVWGFPPFSISSAETLILIYLKNISNNSVDLLSRVLVAFSVGQMSALVTVTHFCCNLLLEMLECYWTCSHARLACFLFETNQHFVGTARIAGLCSNFRRHACGAYPCNFVCHATWQPVVASTK